MDIRQQLAAWCERMWAANQHVNLTRHTTWEAFVGRDLVDVLELSKLLRPDLEVLDIGSGGGVPGLALAIVRPDLKVTVCDSVGKKARLLQSFVDDLQLPVAVFNERAEKLLEELGFDCCVARAVGPLWKVLSWLKDHWASARRLYAFKGPRWHEELAEAKARGLTRFIHVKAVARYPLRSTDPDAPPLESVILQIHREGG
jgi:16S rRNA (guanine527-N7)-methyltransferase